jgi:putative flippase GtrA
MRLENKGLPHKELRYLVVGVLNTVVGYGIGVMIYTVCHPHVSLSGIGIVSNVLAITFSVVTYKCMVFQTQGQWFREYVRAYLIYGGTALLGIALLWFLVGRLALSIWLAQGIIVIVTIVISYLGHSRFTFHRS